MIVVNLVYPAFRWGDPPKGHAVGRARLTPKQIIVESGRVTSGRVLLGGLPLRFRRDNFRPIPYRDRGWRIKPEVEGGGDAG